MHCLIRHSFVDRWTGGGGTAAQVYIPKSPLSALPAVAVLSGFSTEFMRSHAIGRATIAVPPAWIDVLVPNLRQAYQTVRRRNHSAVVPDWSGEKTLQSLLFMCESFWQSTPFFLAKFQHSWWVLGLPEVTTIFGSQEYCTFQQQVSLLTACQCSSGLGHILQLSYCAMCMVIADMNASNSHCCDIA